MMHSKFIKIICFPLCLHMAPPRPFQTVEGPRQTGEATGVQPVIVRYIGIEIAHIITWCIVICATLKLVPCIYTCIHGYSHSYTHIHHIHIHIYSFTQYTHIDN